MLRANANRKQNENTFTYIYLFHALGLRLDYRFELYRSLVECCPVHKNLVIITTVRENHQIVRFKTTAIAASHFPRHCAWIIVLF